MSPEHSPVAIDVRGLGKQYRIGAEKGQDRTLGETVADALAAPLRRATGLLRGEATGAAELHETIWALRDVSFSVRKGEVLGVIGKNGAGKSTLLKVLSRITEPTEGYAELYGTVASLIEVGTGFHRELTGRENVYLNGAILGMNRSEIDRKFDRIVDFAEIRKFIDTPVKHYSSGMYVRLAFAVAAHLDPEILLVDEVLAVGDAAFQQKCLGRMDEVAQAGRTVLFVSHNMATMNRLCERVLWIHEGRIRMDGPAKEVIGRYLAAGSVLAGERVWDEGTSLPGVEEVRLDAVRVRDARGRASSHIDPSQPFEVAIRYRVLRQTPVFRVGFLLEMGDGTILFDSYDTDEERYAAPRAPGIYTSRCTIPANLLAPGRYFITIDIGAPKIKHFVVAKCALAIDVQDTGVVGLSTPGGRNGLLRPKLEWTLDNASLETAASGT